MCEIDWDIILGYLKVLLSWPPIILLVAIYFMGKFKSPIINLLNRVEEGDLWGGKFKAPAPSVQQIDANPNDMGLNKLAAADKHERVAAAGPQITLPPELMDEPEASRLAIEYVTNNPIPTVIEFKRVFFSYNCERLFNLIFGSQIALLEYLSARPDGAAPLGELVRFHNAHIEMVKANNPQYQYQLRDYMNFLISFGTLNPIGKDEICRISKHGREFLSYIKSNYSLVWNQRFY